MNAVRAKNKFRTLSGCSWKSLINVIRSLGFSLNGNLHLAALYAQAF